jgi:hypothetical protein
LLGAVYGKSAIPDRWTEKILNCRPKAGTPGVKQPRPECCWPADALEIAEQLAGKDEDASPSIIDSNPEYGGAPGENSEKIATRDSWKILPIDNPKRIEFDLLIPGVYFDKLKRGLIPQAMEDKWFIYFEDDWLYFHRSWTGYGIYKAELRKKERGYSIQEFFVEQNDNEFHCEEDENRRIFAYLLIRGLLRLFFYPWEEKKSPYDALAKWHLFGRMMFGIPSPYPIFEPVLSILSSDCNCESRNFSTIYGVSPVSSGEQPK